MSEKSQFYYYPLPTDREAYANLLIKVTDDNALYRIRNFLAIPIARVQIGDCLRQSIQINGVVINVLSDPFEVVIFGNDGSRIELSESSAYEDQVLAYLKSISTDDGFWDYKGNTIVKIGEEGLDRQKFELRRQGKDPIPLTISVAKGEDAEKIKRKVQSMVDRILGA
ncbi:hypothetical protein ACFL3T_01600 [Patescibacteria group bacterium]